MAKNKDLFSSNIDKISIGAFSEDAYLNYSMYVILIELYQVYWMD